jgi:hypothetical protein
LILTVSTGGGAGFVSVVGMVDILFFNAKTRRRKGAKKGIQPRISRITRIRNKFVPIREIREIRGKKPSWKCVMLTGCGAKQKALCDFASLRLCVENQM